MVVKLLAAVIAVSMHSPQVEHLQIQLFQRVRHLINHDLIVRDSPLQIQTLNKPARDFEIIVDAIRIVLNHANHLSWHLAFDNIYEVAVQNEALLETLEREDAINFVVESYPAEALVVLRLEGFAYGEGYKAL